MRRPLAFDKAHADDCQEHTNVKPKNTICLWFDKDALVAYRVADVREAYEDLARRHTRGKIVLVP
jgi:hypothetical protein